MRLRYDEYSAEAVIDVLSVEPSRSIVFRWHGTTHVVTIELQPRGAASTVVTVREDGFEPQDPALVDALLDNKEGWVYALTCLKAYLEAGVDTLRAALLKS